MSFSPDRIGSEAWNALPTVETFVDPLHTEHPERLLHGRLDMNTLAGLSAVGLENYPAAVLEGFRKKGLVLDIGCGILPHLFIGTLQISQEALRRGVFHTPVGVIANAYGIDPAFEFFIGNALAGRTLPAYAEDLPFRDKIFDITASTKGVGWHTGTSFEPYWSIKEMVRVTAPEGLVIIQLGSGGSSLGMADFSQNCELITSAISRLQSEDFGRSRIKAVKDFRNKPAPQINLVVK